MFASLAKGQKLDLKDAYAQVTTKGLFQYAFGVAAAPVLQGIPNTGVYLDDDEQHLETLDKVLSRLEEAGARLKKEKCHFMLPSVEYLGHRIWATTHRWECESAEIIPRNVELLQQIFA